MNNKAYNNSIIKSHISSYFFTPIFYVVVGLIIFICFSFVSCGRASAEGMIQSDRDFLHDYFLDGFTADQWSYIDGVMDECPYFITFQTTDGSIKAVCFMPYSSYYTYDDIHGSNNLSEPDLEIQITYNNVNRSLDIGCYYGRLCPFSIGDIHSSSNDNPYRWFCFCTGMESTATGLIVIPSSMQYDDSSTWHCRWYNSSRRSISGFDSHAIQNWYYDPAYVNCNYNARVIRGSYTITETYAQNVFPVIYTEDSRLKFSTSLRGDGEKLLNTDLSDFLHWGPSSGMSVSDLVLTLDCDGVEVPVSLDSNNSEIIFTKNQNDYSYRCVYITPYSELGLDSYEDVTIVKCDFTRIYNHLGSDSPEVEDFKISCSYVLKNETAPIESEEIPLDASVDSDKLSVVEITDLHNSFQFSEGEFVSDLSDIVAPDNFSFVEICVSTLPLQTLNNILSYVPYILLTPETGVNATQAAEKVIYEYLEDNYYTCVFDYIIFDWVFYDDPENSDAGYDHLYFYYNTLSGRVRLIDNVLADIYVDVNQNTANTAAIYNYLFTRLNDFEDTSLDALNDIIGLDRQRNSWLGTLSSGIFNLSFISSNGFSDVVDAVNAIEFDFVPFDDSDILSALSDISSKLTAIFGRDDNEDDTVSEAIAYYLSNNSGGLPTQDVYLDNKMSLWMSGKVHVWLQGSSAADSRQGLLIDSFDFMSQFYDSLQSHGLIGGVRNYVRSFTSGTSSGSAETVYKTIWTGSFDPNLKDGE